MFCQNTLACKPSDSKVAHALPQTASWRGATTLHAQDIVCVAGFKSKRRARMCHDAMGVDQNQSGAAFLDRLRCRFQYEGNATGFGCVKGCSCHLLACQRPIRFALQRQFERMPRWWQRFWTSSVAMLMWGMEMADKNSKERGFLQRMVPRSAVVSQLPACGPSWTLSVGEVKFKKTQLVKHTHRRITPFSYHVYVGRRWSTKRILKHS